MRVAAALAFSLLLVPTVARAEDDCPAGTYSKSEDGFTWCQPTVCIDDTQCNPGQVCRPYSLCMKIGELNDSGAAMDGGARLFATQACAADKRCPQLQTCSTMGRCFTPAVADRLGLLSTAAPPPDAPKKSSCGCSVVGTESRADTALSVAGFGVAIIALRARARRRAR